MKITVNNLKKLVKRIVRPDENSGKEKDTFEAALKRARMRQNTILRRSFGRSTRIFLTVP